MVLTNQSGYEPAMLIRNTIADLLLDVKPTDWLNVYLENQEESLPNTNNIITRTDPVPAIIMASSQLPELVGSYVHPGYGTMEIFQEDEFLYTYFRRRKLKVVPTDSENVFHAMHIVSPLIKEKSYPYQFNLNLKLKPLIFKRSCS